ncbi:MAG: hypothetical protein C5B52_11670 [Bacteroidetes bacterium]|nr:MAG: hypothetical protein C5B52_11670 [Bacteroidota bacterium]
MMDCKKCLLKLKNMQDKIFTKYVHDHFDQVVKYLHEYKSTWKGDDLYEVRTNLKKIRACVDCMENINDTSRIKKVKHRVNKVFHKSGSVRETQLQLEWLKKNRLQRTIDATGIETSLEDSEKKFQKKNPVMIRKLKKKHDTIMKSAKDYEQEDIIAYFYNSRKTFKEMIQNDLPEENWHDLRKLTKKILYSYHWLPEDQSNFLNKITTLDRWDHLQTAIGLWHDEKIRKEWLGSSETFLSDDVKLKKEFDRAWQKVESSEKTQAKKIRTMLKKEIESIQGLPI